MQHHSPWIGAKSAGGRTDLYNGVAPWPPEYLIQAPSNQFRVDVDGSNGAKPGAVPNEARDLDTDRSQPVVDDGGVRRRPTDAFESSRKRYRMRQQS